jgi:uncharacterized membrane protein YbaN (DUF454 family)
MSEWILISMLLVAILVLVGIFLILVIWKKSKEGKQVESDYRVFFIIGLLMTPLGIIGMTASFFADTSFFIGLPFFSIGVVYIVIGLGNRDKWKKK